MYVRRLIHTFYDIHRNAFYEVAALLFVDQGHDAFICCAVSCLERKQACCGEKRSIYSPYCDIFSSYSSDYVVNIICKTSFIRATVHFSHNPTPEPLSQYFLSLRLIIYGLSNDCTD